MSDKMMAPVKGNGEAMMEYVVVAEEMPQKQAIDTHINLQPIASPAMLGLYAQSVVTFVVGAYLAGWYGDATTPNFLFPFAALIGGLAQFVAGIWAHRARDPLASVLHGIWGSFWLAYGALYAFVAAGTITLPTGGFQALGFLFIPLAVISLIGTIASGYVSLSHLLTWGTLTIGAALLAIGELTSGATLSIIGGWALVVSAILAAYTASALLLKGVAHRRVLPLGRFGAMRKDMVRVGVDEPGVMRGE